MSRYRYTGLSYAFGPGPASPAIKAIIWTNVAAFLATWLAPQVIASLGLTPAAVVEELWLWQPVTYMFLHADVFHILFNMLALWMFGVELERLWGTHYFLRYYFLTGLGAAATTLVVSLLPFAMSDRMYYSVTIGASGAVYGVLLAFGLYYPDRPIYMYFLFPVPARYFVMIIGAIVFLSSISDTRGGVAHAAHLGGLVFGYLYLMQGRGGLLAAIKYRYVKWRMNRLRRRFDVRAGGRRDDRDRWVH